MSTEKQPPVHKVKNPALTQEPPKNLIRPDTSAKPSSTQPEKGESAETPET